MCVVTHAKGIHYVNESMYIVSLDGCCIFILFTNAGPITIAPIFHSFSSKKLVLSVSPEKHDELLFVSQTLFLYSLCQKRDSLLLIQCTFIGTWVADMYM